MNIRPLKYHPPLSPDLLKAYESMPRLDGHVVGLFFTPAQRVAAHEAQWREWLRTHDKALWPEWVERWSDKRRREQRAA